MLACYTTNLVDSVTYFSLQKQNQVLDVKFGSQTRQQFASCIESRILKKELSPFVVMKVVDTWARLM